jgi:hypothetical protein
MTLPNVTVSREPTATVYVDNLKGSDRNDGSTPMLAFGTVQAAVNYAADYAVRTVQLVTTGFSYGENVVLPTRIIGSGYVTIQGDPNNNTSVQMSGAQGPCFTAVNSNGFILSSLRVSTGGPYAVISDAQSHLLATNMNYGGAAVANIFAEHAGFYEDLAGSCVVSGGAQWHIAVAARGHYVSQGHFISFQGNPQFSSSFALGSTGGFLDGRLITFSGAHGSGIPNGINNDGTALMYPNPNGGWP